MNVDLVPFLRGVRVLCKSRLIFSRMNGPIVTTSDADNPGSTRNGGIFPADFFSLFLLFLTSIIIVING